MKIRMKNNIKRHIWLKNSAIGLYYLIYQFISQIDHVSLRYISQNCANSQKGLNSMQT